MADDVRNILKINGTKLQVAEVFDRYSTYIKPELSRNWNNEIICYNKEGKVGFFNEKTGLFKTREGWERFGMPEGWEMDILEGMNRFPDFNKIIPCPTDHDPYWNMKNWGTKRNAQYCKVIEQGTYYFETAWDDVLELMKELSRQNPDIEFEYNSSKDATKFIINNGITKEDW